MDNRNNEEIDYREFFDTPEEHAAKVEKAKQMREKLIEKMYNDPEMEPYIEQIVNVSEEEQQQIRKELEEDYRNSSDNDDDFWAAVMYSKQTVEEHNKQLEGEL